MTDTNQTLSRFKVMESEIGTTERAWILGTYGAAQTFFTVRDLLDEVYEMTSALVRDHAALTQERDEAIGRAERAEDQNARYREFVRAYDAWRRAGRPGPGRARRDRLDAARAALGDTP